MYKLNLVLRKDSAQITLDMLEKAASERKIAVNKIYSDEYDFSTSINLWENDLLYRIWTDSKSALIEKLLINDSVKSFYTSPIYCIWKFDNVIECTIVHEKNKLPIIKSIYSLTNDKNLLKQHVEYLNWFPIILKSTWGSHWVWVLKADSFDSLSSITDYILNLWDDVILREYIDYEKHLRVIVLWNEVAWSVEYKRVKWDFRSNVWDTLEVIKCELSDDIKDIAIKSVQTVWRNYWWVDILVDKQWNPFIAEVNMPCFFPRTQEISGEDIAWKMLDYLTNS